MLEAIGVSSVDELFEQIPAGVRFERALDVEPALSEAEIMRLFEELAGRNAHTGVELSFLGMGVYDHYVPAVVDLVMSRGEFLTAYTPYQPEMSQGVLQAIFEYQTAICELTGMDVSNASGTTGAPSPPTRASSPSTRPDGSKVVVAETVNPMVRQVVKTYAPGFGLEVVEVPHSEGATDPDELAAASADAAAVLFQQPNVFGVLEDAPALAAAAAARARSRSRTSTRSRSACSRRRGRTAARSRSARARAPATSRATAGRTTASWRPGWI